MSIDRGTHIHVHAFRPVARKWRITNIKTIKVEKTLRPPGMHQKIN